MLNRIVRLSTLVDRVTPAKTFARIRAEMAQIDRLTVPVTGQIRYVGVSSDYLYMLSTLMWRGIKKHGDVNFWKNREATAAAMRAPELSFDQQTRKYLQTKTHDNLASQILGRFLNVNFSPMKAPLNALPNETSTTYKHNGRWLYRDIKYFSSERIEPTHGDQTLAPKPTRGNFTDLSLQSEAPIVIRNGIGVVAPFNLELASFRMHDSRNNELRQGLDFELMYNSQTEQAWIKPLKDLGAITYEAGFRRPKTSSAQNTLPHDLAALNHETLLNIANELRESGLNRLAASIVESVQTSRKTGSPISIHNLESLVQNASRYSYEPHKAEMDAHKNPEAKKYAYMKPFVGREGFLEMQCNGAAFLQADLLNDYFASMRLPYRAKFSEVYLSSKSSIGPQDAHAIVTIENANSRLAVLDSTATEFDSMRSHMTHLKAELAKSPANQPHLTLLGTLSHLLTPETTPINFDNLSLNLDTQRKLLLTELKKNPIKANRPDSPHVMTMQLITEVQAYLAAQKRGDADLTAQHTSLLERIAKVTSTFQKLTDKQLRGGSSQSFEPYMIPALNLAIRSALGSLTATVQQLQTLHTAQSCERLVSQLPPP